MSRRSPLPLLAAGLSLTSLFVVGTPSAAGASWQGTHCNTSDTATQSAMKVSAAASYAYSAIKDGYQWGGGCWVDDDVDATPNDPTEQTSTAGEGGDCSGLTFKTWHINATGDASTLKAGWRYWGEKFKVHGPYAAADFRNSRAVPSTSNYMWKSESKSIVTRMDALASSTHVAMYWGDTSKGVHEFIEAKGEHPGTNIWAETYLSNTSFAASARQGWLAECYPRCS